MENIIYRNNEGIEYIQFKRLLEYPEVTHCYTMRSNNQLNFQIKNIIQSVYYRQVQTENFWCMRTINWVK